MEGGRDLFFFVRCMASSYIQKPADLLCTVSAVIVASFPGLHVLQQSFVLQATIAAVKDWERGYSYSAWSVFQC